jgi:predicted metal-dependent peptidase
MTQAIPPNMPQDWFFQTLRPMGFLQRYPMYAAVLSRMNVLADEGVPVMGVSESQGRLYLHVSLSYFLKPAHLPFLVGVLLHEIHHVVLGHTSHAKFRDVAFPRLMTIAMEISANEYIKEPLPGSPMLLEGFHEYGIRPHQSTLTRYECLVKALSDGKDPEAKVKPLLDSHSWAWTGGEADDNDGSNGESSPSSAPSTILRERAVEKILKEVAKEAKAQPSHHRLAGREPAHLQEMLAAVRASEHPKSAMDWKAALQIFVSRLRKPIHRYDTPNRRFPQHVGLIPGRRRMISQGEKPRLLVVIDTSGSITTQEILAISLQLQSMVSLATILLVECDATIHRVTPYKGGPLRSVMGRGGTDLRPPFAAEFLQRHRPEGIIYFTDGYGPFPDDRPHLPVLWVLTCAGDFACPWGERVLLRGL